MNNTTEFPTLSTARLVLRALRTEDAADVLVFRGDPYVQRFNSESLQTVQEAADLIHQLQQGDAAQHAISWGVTRRGEDRVIGLFGLHSWSHYHRRAEVGYDLAHAAWGQGIGTEAVRAIVHYGFTSMNLNRIEAATIADNHESVNLLKSSVFGWKGSAGVTPGKRMAPFTTAPFLGCCATTFLKGSYRSSGEIG